MTVVFTETFARAYRKLPSDLQGRVDNTIRLLGGKKAKKPFHPSLRTKRIQGTPDICEASVTMKYRLTFQVHAGTLYLRVVADHDRALKKP